MTRKAKPVFDIDRETAIQIDKEGHEYTNDPKDSGGPTKYGVTEAVARAFGYKGDMKNLDYALAFMIFKELYYLQPKFDQVVDVSEPIGAKLYEIGINMGTGRGVRFLQRALNSLNQEAKLYPDLVMDGAIGRLTLYCLKTYLEHRGHRGEHVLLEMIRAQQRVFYIELSERRQKDERFQYGWQSKRV